LSRGRQITQTVSTTCCYTISMNKRGPYFLIASLVLVIVFIAGLQYGKQVEKTNKTITALLSITPTRPIEPIKIGYIRFEHKQCGVSFVYPSLISQVKQSSTSAKLEDKQAKETINLSCDRIVSIENSNNQATGSSIIAGSEVITNIVDKDIIEFTLAQPKTGKRIHFVVNKELLPLLEETLAFL